MNSLCAKAERRAGAGGEVLQEDVSAADQSREHVRILRILQVEANAFFGSIHPYEVGRQPSGSTVVTARKVPAVGTLHLDHAGPLVSEVPAGEWCGDRVFERYDGDAF